MWQAEYKEEDMSFPDWETGELRERTGAAISLTHDRHPCLRNGVVFTDGDIDEIKGMLMDWARERVKQFDDTLIKWPKDFPA